MDTKKIKTLLAIGLVATFMPLSASALPGDVDYTFANPNLRGVTALGADLTVVTMAIQKDGKIIVAGAFTNIAGANRDGFARLNANGTIDSTLNATFDGDISAIAVQTDGKILVGGTFQTVNSVARNYLVRLNTNGTLDTTFNASLSSSIFADSPRVTCLAIQPNGQIIVGGYFNSAGAVTRYHIARLNSATGSVDTGFSNYLSSTVLTVALQTNNSVVIGGSFNAVNGTTRNNLARLNNDGSLDTGFNPNANAAVNAIALQPDGKILVGGEFTTISATTRRHLARLLATGSLDSGFNPNVDGVVTVNDFLTLAPTNVNSIGLQSDGKILIGGNFLTVGGVNHPGIARLNTTGSADAGFSPYANAKVLGLALQEDGRVLVAGELTTMNEVVRSGLARLENDAAAESLTVVNSGRVEWLRGGSASEVADVDFQYSIDGGATWSGLGVFDSARIAGGWAQTGIILSGSGLIRTVARVLGGSGNGSAGLLESQIAYTIAPEIVVEQPAGTNLGDNGSRSYGYMLVGASSNLTFTIRNTGNANLTGLTVTKDGANSAEFVVISNPVAPVNAAGNTTMTVRFTPATAGPRSAALHLASNDADESPFDINLSGYALVGSADDDNDGLSNASELNLWDFGFHPLVDSSALLTELRTNGLYQTSELQALALNAPVLEKNPANGHFALRLSVDKSPDLSSNSWTRLTGFAVSNDASAGTITLDITPTNSSPQFYRLLGAKP